MPVHPEKLSPNQLDKRQRIVDAAKAVLLRSGPTACSTREVAREGGFTPGLIHYYFATVDEIVDTAMTDLFADITTAIRAAEDGQEDPAERFWALVESYLGHFEQHLGLALLWFEYWVMVTRQGRPERIETVPADLIDVLEEVLADAGVEDAAARARVVLSYVTGVLVRREVTPQTFDELRPEIAGLAHVES